MAFVRFAEPLVEGRLIRRYKRFLADVRLPSGDVEVVHCANPGSMKTCLAPEARVWLSRRADPRRKLAHTLEIIEIEKELVFVNPVLANRVVEEALRTGVVRELRGLSNVRREVPFPGPGAGGKSPGRADFFAEDGGGSPCYVEVKNVTLSLGGGRTAFPDAVTERGRRHLAALSAVARSGQRAVLLYCASRSRARSVEAARDIDPAYAEALGDARRDGVQVLAYGCDISPQAVRLARPLPAL